MVNVLKGSFKINLLYYVYKSNVKKSSPLLINIRKFYTSDTMFKSSIFNLQESSKDQVQAFLNSFDTVLTDCDGECYV